MWNENENLNVPLYELNVPLYELPLKGQTEVVAVVGLLDLLAGHLLGRLLEGRAHRRGQAWFPTLALR